MKNFKYYIVSSVFLTFVLLLVSCSGAADSKVETVALDSWQSYIIVRPDVPGEGEVSAAVAIRSAIEDTLGVELELTTDWVKRGESAPSGTLEILVGSTNREESETGLKYRDWEVEFVGGRLAIRAKSEECISAAVDWFIKNCISPEGISYPGEKYGVYGEYPLADVTIDNIKLSQYKIETSNAELAAQLKDFISEGTGEIPPEKSDNVIVIENSDALGIFDVSVKSNGKGKIEIATNKIELTEAYNMFIDAINNRQSAAIDKLDLTKSVEVVDFTAGAEKLAEVNKLADERIVEIRATESQYEVGKDGTIWYISNRGDNMNDGKSPESPKADLDGIGNLKAGDVVLFERGGLWRKYFKTVSGVTYSAYGKGDKPMIYASPENGADASKWKLVEGTNNIWVYATEMMDCGNLIFNEGESYAYKAVPIWKDGKFLVKSTMQEFDPKKDLAKDLEFFCKADSKFSGNTTPVSDTDNIGEVYLRCDKGNPGELYDSIEFLIRRNGIGLAGDNVIIDNLCVKYVGAHGIGGGTVGNVTIRNCEIGWIGGGVQYYTPSENSVTRYGNGIEIYGGCDSYTIENCYVYHCYDAGITHQYQKGGTNRIVEENVTYKNNVIEKCTYNIEYFMGALESGTADRIMRNVLITDNILRDAGRSFGARAHSVDIMGWGHRNEAYNFVIENNTFANAINRIFYIGAGEESWLPVFRNNTYIKEYGGQFALYGLMSKMTESTYTENFDAKVATITGETGGKYYYTLPETAK